jgi:type I restriction enzyme S subunit
MKRDLKKLGNGVTVGSYVTLQRGTTYKGNLVGKPGPALLGLGSIQPGGGFREGDYKTYGGDCPPKLMLSPGDLFVSLKGATKDGKMIGSVARVPSSVPSGRLTQDTVKLQFHDSKLEVSNFLYWILRTPQYRDYCEGRATGSAVVALSRDDFLSFPVPPFTPARLRGVELLESLESKIELNRRMNETLEAMARALFQSWFVDFDPVRAKLDGRKLIGIDPATAALFPSTFQNSPVGYIPQGWNSVTLEDVCSKITDGAHQSPKSVEHGLPMASVKDMTDWGIDINGCRHISEPDFKNLVANGCEPQQGDVLLAKDGATCLETACEFRETHRVVLLSSVSILRPKTSKLSAYLHDWLRFDSTKQYLKESFVSGSAIPRVVLRDLKRARLLVPSEPILTAYDQLTSPLRERLRRNNEQSRTLATLRDMLLPKLLSGEVSMGTTEFDS